MLRRQRRYPCTSAAAESYNRPRHLGTASVRTSHLRELVLPMVANAPQRLETRARRNNGQEIVVRCDCLGPGAGRRATGAAVSARVRRSRTDSGGGVARKSAKRTCGASRSRAPATAAPSDRRSRTRRTSTGRASTMANYTRTINWETGTSKETFDRKPGCNPASWKYGTRMGRTARRRRRTCARRTSSTVNTPGTSTATARPSQCRPELAERLSARHLAERRTGSSRPRGCRARIPGRSGAGSRSKRDATATSSRPEKVHVVAITVLGKYRVDATINSQNSHHPHQDDGERARARRFQHRARVDRSVDVRRTRSGRSPGTRTTAGTTTGSSHRRPPVTTGTAASSRRCSPTPATTRCRCPSRCSRRPRRTTVASMSRRLANGVYLLGGGPANSYMVEFHDFVAVFEAPSNEERSLGVIEAVAKLAPEQADPLADQLASALRPHRRPPDLQPHRRDRRHALQNLEFLNRDVLTYKARTVKPDIVSLWPPTEVAEGYNYEAIQEKLRDHRRHAESCTSTTCSRCSTSPGC